MSAIFSRFEISVLRNIIAVLRKRSILSRGEISNRTGINPVDLDNFIYEKTNKDGVVLTKDGKVAYKSQNPSDEGLLVPLYRYVINDLAHNSVVDQVPGLRTEIATILGWRKPGQIFEGATTDHLFAHFEKEDIWDVRRARAICDQLSGAYNCYRLSSDGKEILKSALKIRPFDVSERTPRFIDEYVNGLGERMATVGNIFDMGDRLHMMGFVRVGAGSKKSWLGQKVLVVKKPSSRRSEVFGGIYLCVGARASFYEMGKVALIRSPYDRTKMSDEYNSPLSSFGGNLTQVEDIKKELSLVVGDQKNNLILRSSIAWLG
jgi:hypothetical protein